LRRQPPPPTVPANNPTGICRNPDDDAHAVPDMEPSPLETHRSSMRRQWDTFRKWWRQ
jgi:hypothetical protein